MLKQIINKKYIWCLIVICLVLLVGCGDNEITFVPRDRARLVSTDENGQLEPEKNTDALSASNIFLNLSWWGKDERHGYMLKGVQDFQTKHPNIIVSSEYAEWTGYETGYNIRMISDSEDDVMMVNYDWLTKYSEDGTGYYDLEKLGAYLDLSGYSENELEFGRQNGVLNAVPVALNTLTFYYDETIYDNYGLEIPKTWDDLFNAARIMQGNCFPTAMAKKTVMLAMVAHEEQMTGIPFLDQDGKVIFSRENIANMLNFYRELVFAGVIPPVDSYERTHTDDGSYAGFVAWVSNAESYSKNAVARGDKMVVGMPVTVNDYKRYGWYIKPAMLYAISKNTRNPEASALLLDYLINDMTMAELQGIEKGYPLNNKVAKIINVQDMPLQYEAHISMEKDISKLQKQTVGLENSVFVDSFTEGCRKVEYRKADVDKIAEEVYNKIVVADSN